MKGGKAAALIFAPSKSKDLKEEDDDESVDLLPGEDPGDDLSSLLGNAFDAIEDGDRAGFMRSMKAVLRSKE